MSARSLKRSSLPLQQAEELEGWPPTNGEPHWNHAPRASRVDMLVVHEEAHQSANHSAPSSSQARGCIKGPGRQSRTSYLCERGGTQAKAQLQAEMATAKSQRKGLEPGGGSSSNSSSFFFGCKCAEDTRQRVAVLPVVTTGAIAA